MGAGAGEGEGECNVVVGAMEGTKVQQTVAQRLVPWCAAVVVSLG